MKFVHSDEVLSAFPANYTCIVVNMRARKDTEYESATRALLDEIGNNEGNINEAIQKWRTIFDKMGAKPKYCSSIEALKRFYEKNGRIYAISVLVDFYNAYSLCKGLPMAAYDHDKIIGDMYLRAAKKDELFIPLGNPKQVEKTKNGEIIYSDNEKVICRYWNLQDCHATRITEETSKVIFVFDILDEVELRAKEKFAEIRNDFRQLFGADIFCGITGAGEQKILEW